MPISVRVEKETEILLEETSRVLKTTKAQVIKRSLMEFCPRVLREKRRRPYDLFVDLLGKVGSGRGDLSVHGEEILRTALRRKH